MTGSRPEPERWARVAELTRQGLSAAMIAEMLKVTKRTVVRDRDKAGVIRPQWGGHPGMSPCELERARSMLEDGCSISEVARTLDRSYEAVRRRFPEYVWTQQQVSEHALSIRYRKALDL
jgi:DNA invertase Pin-like site-specific DNA recombinase